MCEKEYHKYEIYFECGICKQSKSNIITLPCPSKTVLISEGVKTRLRRVSCKNCHDKEDYLLLYFNCEIDSYDECTEITVLGKKIIASCINVDR